jgi:signal transduction histidine kinase
MTLDSDVVRAEPHIEIGKLLERDADTLVELWAIRAAEEQCAAQRVHKDVLRDHLPKFLRGVAKALRQTGEAATRPHETTAEQHGHQRWVNGWSLTELIQDYQILRLVLLEYLEQMLSRPLRVRETMALGVFIDDAIASSISAYVANRDEAVMNAERERAAVLEEASRHKDEFMAMLGHELRNPLAPILTAVKVIQSVSPSDQRTLRSASEVIERQSKHLVRLVDDILDVARIGRGLVELRRERLDISSAVHQAVEAVESMLTSRDQQFVVKLPNAPIHVDADLSRLVQVIANLLNNASKYTPSGGGIWLTAASENGQAVIRVRDSGMGIPKDMLRRVFDLFTQVDGSQQYASGGMGIGLTLVQRLVEQHGGKVTCQSGGAGQGSEFIVRLPLSETNDGAASGPLNGSRASGEPAMLQLKPIPNTKTEK